MRSHTRRLLGLAALMACALAPAPLGAQAGAVEGRVRDDEGSAAYGAQVRLMRGGTQVRASETDRLGFFRMAGVPAGDYTLVASGYGYAEAEQAVRVAPAQVVEVDLVLARRAVELQGITVGAERSRERIRFEEVGGATVRELELVELKRVPGLAEADPL
ncbi:MAG: carboxypeptidase regulatory-like domain-containing protein, partial [Gemmatimonadetes bacterium]|nr:carboxypeptidase regulatory-like domain-containing protein [Gemmatimonadota bacterium]